MPFEIVRNDITKIYCDAIVNAANSTLLGGGGVDGAIHLAAGPQLLEECKTLGGCKTGEAKITKGYNLPAKYVIHTVGPVWHGGNNNEEELLISCYENSLRIAKEYGFDSIAFPLISSGVYGYPKKEALEVARKTITAFLEDNDILVYLVIFDKDAVVLSDELFSDVQKYIDDNYVEIHERAFARSENMMFESECAPMAPAACSDYAVEKCLAPSKSFDEIINDTIDESFSQMLLRKIDESGMKDSQCYKKANIDKTLFSKIRSNPLYKPSKATAIAFAIALELDIKDTNDLLLKAGYALSHSNIFDIIIEYFVMNKNYDVFEINEVLFKYDQPILGSK